MLTLSKLNKLKFSLFFSPLFFLLFASVTFAASPTYRQGKISYSSTEVSTKSTTFAPSVNNGSLIVVAVFAYRWAENPVITSVADNKGNIYTKAGQYPATSSGKEHLSLWYSTNVIGGSSFTVTAYASQQAYLTVAVHEYTGAASSLVFN